MNDQAESPHSRACGISLHPGELSDPDGTVKE